MRTTARLALACAFAATFAAGIFAGRQMPVPFGRGFAPSDGHLHVTEFPVPEGVTDLDVRVVGAGDTDAIDCVRVPGEKGRNGGGDGGDGLFCGGAVVITPGRAGDGPKGR